MYQQIINSHVIIQCTASIHQLVAESTVIHYYTLHRTPYAVRVQLIIVDVDIKGIGFISRPQEYTAR